MAAGLCRGCGILLAQFIRDQGKEYHDACEPGGMFSDPAVAPNRFTNGDPYAARLRDDITEIILWANRRSARSQQTELGASEVGITCMRRLGYRIAGLPTVNMDQDPWPSIVGTAVHAWLEVAVNQFEEVHQIGRWSTEMEVRASEAVIGHTDAYDAQFFAVIDWKNPGTTAMTEIRKGYISQQYIEQIMLYGLGHIKAGRRVERVALVFFPRAGYLGGTYVWSAPYDQELAEAALDRVNRVAAGLVYYKVDEAPSNWEKIPATPSKECSYCNWYSPGVSVASGAGCPGK